ncbi:unnamed protein product [Staurois parvus]|uniref:Uncharacterized protein n=1 Tax=Staurois parvus TaxID=386267 RepID=A0ABN9A7J2_9NEOB|nr:unnamed protein product [Staurois parvus]
MTLDSIMKCAFSYNSNCQTDNVNSYIGAVYDLASLTQQRIRTFPYHSDFIYYLSPHGLRFRRACRIAHLHTDKVIEQRKKLLEKNEELEKIRRRDTPIFWTFFCVRRMRTVRACLTRTSELKLTLSCLKDTTQQPVASPGSCTVWPKIQNTRRSVGRRSGRSWGTGRL